MKEYIKAVTIYNSALKKVKFIENKILNKTREILNVKENDRYNWCGFGGIEYLTEAETRVSFNDGDGFSVTVIFPTYLLEMDTKQFSGKELKLIEIKER